MGSWVEDFRDTESFCMPEGPGHHNGGTEGRAGGRGRTSGARKELRGVGRASTFRQPFSSRLTLTAVILGAAQGLFQQWLNLGRGRQTPRHQLPVAYHGRARLEMLCRGSGTAEVTISLPCAGEASRWGRDPWKEA